MRRHFVIAFAVLVGACSLDVAAIDPPPLESLSAGGQCSGHSSTCTVATDAGALPGRCVNGSCCTGCVARGVCLPGNSVGACGASGAACSSCNGDDDPCTSAACSAGTCVSTVVPDGTACSVFPLQTCECGVCGGCPNATDCVSGECVTSCDAIPVCNLYCVSQPTGAPCALCDLPGHCEGSACLPDVLGPPNCN